VGNGELGFTADVTGMQTFYKEYSEVLPLCTQSQWGWHTKPVSDEQYEYTLSDVVMTEYDYNGRMVSYPKKKQLGNEEIYDWLRVNPHRLNLARIGLFWDGKEMTPDKLSKVRQELKLYEGILDSEFIYHGVDCHVQTACDDKEDTLGFVLTSKALLKELSVKLCFPYGSQCIRLGTRRCAYHRDNRKRRWLS
jgi:hypothetical protein